MKKRIVNGLMEAAGYGYSFLYRLPKGEALVRRTAGGLGRFIYYAPGSGARKQDSMDGVRENFVEMCRKIEADIEIISDTIKPDRFEFFVRQCPYGYHRPDQAGVCDAVMDMDRTLFRRVGAELIILETIVGGASKCRLLMKSVGGPLDGK